MRLLPTDHLPNQFCGVAGGAFQRIVVQVNERQAVSLQKAAFLPFPGYCYIGDNKIKTDQRVAQNFRGAQKQFFVILVANFEIFTGRTAIVDSDFLRQIHSLVRLGHAEGL